MVKDNRNRLLFLLCSVINYMIIPISYMAAIALSNCPVPGLVYLICLVLHVGLAFINAFVTNNIFQYVVCSIHLLISTAIGYPLWMMIRYASSALVDLVPIGIFIGCISSVGCSVGGFFIRRKKLSAEQKETWKQKTADIVITIGVFVAVITISIVVAQPHALIIKNKSDDVVIHCRYEGTVLPEVTLNENDKETIVELLNNHKLYLEMPRQPDFLLNYSIQIGNERFLIGTDMSGVIKYKTRYLHLNSEETEILFDILKQYGAKITY